MESEEKGGGGGGEAGPTTGHRPLLCLRTCKISLTGAKNNSGSSISNVKKNIAALLRLVR